MIINTNAVKANDTMSCLWLGAGDIAQRCLPFLSHLGLTSVFVSRSMHETQSGSVDYRRANIANPNETDDLAKLRPTFLVLSFSPKGRQKEDYERAYFNSLDHILNSLEKIQHVPRFLIFVSSTSVYPQSEGEWVDEQSETTSHNVSSSTMLACESLIAQQPFDSCALRFSGIYGPGRHHLLKRVSGGQKGSAFWTNRIHADDCASVIGFILQRAMTRQAVPRVLLASDNEPILSNELSAWLAPQLKISKSVISSSMTSKRIEGLGKRCNNGLLRSLGYEFQYPSYLSGFPDIISEFNRSK